MDIQNSTKSIFDIFLGNFNVLKLIEETITTVIAINVIIKEITETSKKIKKEKTIINILSKFL